MPWLRVTAETEALTIALALNSHRLLTPSGFTAQIGYIGLVSPLLTKLFSGSTA